MPTIPSVVLAATHAVLAAAARTPQPAVHVSLVTYTKVTMHKTSTYIAASTVQSCCMLGSKHAEQQHQGMHQREHSA